MNIKDFERDWMGKRVTFACCLRRTTVSKTESSCDVRFKQWDLTQRSGAGWVTGVRWVANGRMDWVGEDEGWAWTTESSQPAAMVVTSAMIKPLFVPIESLTLDG